MCIGIYWRKQVRCVYGYTGGSWRDMYKDILGEAGEMCIRIYPGDR